MPIQTKKQRSEAAVKAARTRKRNQRQAEAQAARHTNEAGEATAPPAGPNPRVESKHTSKTTRRGRGKDLAAGGGFVAKVKPTKEQRAAERKARRKGKRQPNRNPRDARSGYTDHVLPNRAAGDVEISQRADPHRNVRRHDIVGGGSTAKVLPVESEGGKKRTVQASGFAPGETVTVHRGHLEQNDSNRAPWSAPLDRAKVRQDGTVEIQVPDGQFVIAGQIERPAPNPRPGGDPITEKRWHYTGVAFS